MFFFILNDLKFHLFVNLKSHTKNQYYFYFPVFKEKCKCGVQEYPQWFKQGEKVMVVNCTNSEFNDNTTMLKQLPLHTQVLLFNGNKIPYLDWNLFGVWDDHVDLKVIDLSNNQIEDIDGKAFHKVKNGMKKGEKLTYKTLSHFISI